MIETIRKQISSGELAVSPEKGDPDLLGDVATTAFFDTQKKTVTFSGKQFYMDTSHAIIGTREIQETYQFDSPKYRTLGKVAEAIESRLQAPRAASSNADPRRQGEPRAKPTAAEVIRELRSRDPSKSVTEKWAAPAQLSAAHPSNTNPMAAYGYKTKEAELDLLKSSVASEAIEEGLIDLRGEVTCYMWTGTPCCDIYLPYLFNDFTFNPRLEKAVRASVIRLVLSQRESAVWDFFIRGMITNPSNINNGPLPYFMYFYCLVEDRIH